MSSNQQDRLLQRQARTSERRAPTVVHLPCCKNGSGEMLAIDDGWQCPVCNWYRGYYRGERHP